MEKITFHDYPVQMEYLDDAEILEVSGGALPAAWAIGFGLAAIFGASFSAGYTFGRDYWAP